MYDSVRLHGAWPVANRRFGCGNDQGDPLPKTRLTGFKYFQKEPRRENKSFVLGKDGTLRAAKPRQGDARRENKSFTQQVLWSLAKLPFVIVPQLLRSTRVATTEVAARPEVKTLYSHVEALTRLDRSFLNQKDLGAAGAYIKGQWEKQGLAIEEQPFTTPKGEFKNLMVSFGPPDAERIVVGAHYDVCITEFPGGFKPGADDNASGVAVLLELSRLLKHHAPKLKYRVDLVAYANEEPPFFRTKYMGSAIHAQSLKDAGTKVKAMLALDTVGYYSDKAGSQGVPSRLVKWLAPSVGNFIALVGEPSALNLARKAKRGIKLHSPMPAHMLVAPSFIPGIDFSDHLNYTRHGWPGIMVTDTAMNRNANYHQNTDTLDTLNFDKMSDLTQGLYGLIANF